MVRPIVFCSDYGLSDEFVGVCHGVIARIAPDARVIDLVHGIPAMNVVHGAALLCSAVGYMPADAVFLAVVDPGVGSDRKAVAVEASGGALLVGPDNGLLSLAWDALGGAARVVEITSPDVILEPRSQTFHGRDVFAPAAARLASGADLGSFGPALPVDGLTVVSVAPPTVTAGDVRCAVLSIDRFGNVQLSAREEHLAKAGLAEADEFALDTDEAGAITLRRARTFADVGWGEAALLSDSAGWLTGAVNGGSLAEALRVHVGDPVVLTRAGTSPAPRFGVR
ncbi:MAG: S-adenosyl-l-methionine hydroxide adenosyltransferase family protein [Actinomycetota bacterium]